MSKRTYKIERINAILEGGSIDTVPAFYIHGDEDLLRLFDYYNGRVPIKIVGTNSGYDNRLSYASLRPSKLTGGYRPNFQQQTQLLCVIPEFAWEGYPPQTGELQILYQPEDVELYQDYENQPLLGDVNSSCTTKTICKLTLVLFLAIMAIALLRDG